MSEIYFASYYIDLVNDTYIEFKAKESIKRVIKESGDAQSNLNIAAEKLVLPQYSDMMKEFFDLSTLNERLKNKTVVSVEYEGVTSGWSMAHMIAGDRDENGNLCHVFYAARTIHDEKARETEQNRRLEDLKNIITNAGFGVWHIILEEGKAPKMEVNDKMAELLGIKNKKLSLEENYENWYSRIVPSALPSVNKSVDKMLKGKFSENTYLWNHPKFGERYVRCGGTLEKSTDTMKALSGYHYDVTDIVLQDMANKKELEEAREQAEAANRAKSLFLFSMSHDIRTPMNAIIGYTDLLERHMDDRNKIGEYVDKIRTSGTFLLSLINDVLEVARIESGKETLDETVCEITSITEEIATVFSERMESKGINFIKHSDFKTKYIYVDVVKTKEIYLNIVSNAYKYTLPGGTVTFDFTEIPCEKEGFATYKTVISDTGIGMSPEFLPHLFEEFSREKTYTEDGNEGTGLGMPIVKKLIELMDGSISVESELGKGTSFTIITTHRISSGENVGSELLSEIDKKFFEGKRILLAEDNEINAEIAHEILTEEGFLVEHAGDGIVCIDMLTKAQEDYYDLILMDIQMPNMNGYKASQIIRSMENEVKANIPIIAMTANAFDEDRQNAINAGMNDHVGKPFKVDDLLRAIERALKKK